MVETGTSNPPSKPLHKIYGITNIRSYVPLLLDLDRLNYDAWRELFKTHCVGFSVFDHLAASAVRVEDPEWDEIDAIVKQWIYGTISQTLLQTVLTPDATAAAIWQSIEALFRENKESKAMELDDELRSITIGDSTIVEYCTKVKSIADLMANIGSPVPEKNLVIYTINGLSPKYAHIVTTIRHQKPFPTFVEMRSMLTLEERSMLKDQARLVHASHQDHSSAPTVLNANHDNRGQSNNRGSSTNNRGGGRNNRGGGRGGRRGGRGGQRGGSSATAPSNNGWGVWYPWPGPFPQQRPNNPGAGVLPTPWPTPPQPHHTQQQCPNTAPNPNPHNQAFVAGPAPQQPTAWSYYNFPTPNADHATSLPHAFSTMNLQDPGNVDWYMDTGATAHLHADPGFSHQTDPPAM